MGQVEALLARIEDAWNRADASAYAACYAEDASYVNREGLLFLGRAAIEERHRTAFNDALRGTKLKIKVCHSKTLRESIMVLHVDAELQGLTAVWARATFVICDGLIVAAQVAEV